MTCHAVYELRNYRLHPGARDDLIALFEREFVESQESQGIRIVATFRDLGHPDRFVWIRSFPDMDRRLAALTAFYTGPVWRAHRAAANATMIDSDDVLLLKPAAGRLTLPATRPARAAHEDAEEIFRAAIYPPGPIPAVLDARQAVFVTEPGPNTFPRLPVRDVNVRVVFGPETVREPAGLPPPQQMLRLRPTARSLLR